MLLTTHYLEEADQLADQLAIVDRGRVVAAGTAGAAEGELRGDALGWSSWATAPAGPPVLARRRGRSPLGRPDAAGPGRRRRPRVPAVLAGLEAAGLAPASVTVARPSLDDVYLRHTGRAFAADATPSWQEPPDERARGLAARVGSDAVRRARARARPAGRGADAGRDGHQPGHLAGRGVRALLRQPWFIAITLVQPVIWLLLFGRCSSNVVPGFPTATTSPTSRPGSW